MSQTLRHAAGSLLVVGLAGAELTALERAWLKLIRPAGIILFRRNIESPQQTRALLSDATRLCARNSIRCVDVEGGTVDRLRDALAPSPSVQAVMRAASVNSAKLIRQHGELIGRSVRAFGFNTTLAPVLDLALPASAKVMGTRVASASPEEVVLYARGFLTGLAAQGIAGCGKHFPGLGAGTLDSHLETPSIQRSMKLMNNEDLAPYRDLKSELPMIMVNHAAYPSTPSGIKPASVSPFWIGTVLRKRIGYKGIIFSDDLEMGGILKFMPMEVAVIAAVRAGMDLMEICHSPELILRAYEALLTEAERSSAFRALLLKRSTECASKRSKLFTTKMAPALSQKQFEALRANLQKFSATVQAAQEGASS